METGKQCRQDNSRDRKTVKMGEQWRQKNNGERTVETGKQLRRENSGEGRGRTVKTDIKLVLRKHFHQIKIFAVQGEKVCSIEKQFPMH